MSISLGNSTKIAVKVMVHHVALAAFAVTGLGAIAVLSGAANGADHTSNHTRISPPSAYRYMAPDDLVNIVLVTSGEQKARIEQSMDLDANHIAELGISVPKPATVLVKGTPAADDLITAIWQASLPRMNIIDLTLP